MKGEVFNLLERFIVEGWGAEKFEEIYEKIHCNLKTKEPFVGPGTYPDSDFMIMAEKSADILGVPLTVAVYEFGKFAFPHLASKLPSNLISHESAKEFLKTIDSVVHVEVRKLYRDSSPPSFGHIELPDGRLILNYRSKRNLYDFVEGLIQGVAAHFKTTIEVHRELESDGAKFTLTFH